MTRQKIVSSAMIALLVVGGCPAPVPVSDLNDTAATAPEAPPQPEPPTQPDPPPRPNLDGAWYLVGLDGYGDACITIADDTITSWQVGCSASLSTIEAELQAEISAALLAYDQCYDYYSLVLADLANRGLSNTTLAANARSDQAECATVRDAAIALAESGAALARLEVNPTVQSVPFDFADGVVVWSIMLYFPSDTEAYTLSVVPVGAGLTGVMEVGLGMVQQGSIEIIMTRN